MITYTDKVDSIVNPNPDINKWTAANANEVKNEVNANITATNSKQAGSAELTAIAAIAPANDDIIQRKAGAWTNRTLAQVATDLGLDAGTIVPVTGATSLSASAFGKIHILTGTTSNYTVDLPTAVGNTGKSIIIKGANALTKDVTIQGVSGQLIDDESNRKISSGGSFTLMSDGTNWQLINEVGSWINYTPIWSGFSVDPTFDRAMYFRVGKSVRVVIRATANGTSSANTTSVTVPFNADGTGVQFGKVPQLANNGVNSTVPGIAFTRVNANTVDLYRDAQLLAWTASGGKRANLDITYRIA